MFQRLIITMLVIGTGFIFGYITAASSFDSYDAVQKVSDIEDEVSKKIAVAVNGEKTREYESQYGFSFVYPSSFHLENAHVAIPGRDFIRAVGVMRYIPVSWCPNASKPAECAPFLENPGIAFGIIAQQKDALLKNELKNLQPFMEKVVINDNEGLQYLLSNEGEGIVTILFDIDREKTLIVQYTYDEAFDKDDGHAKGVLSVARQKEKVDTILSTLEIK